MNSPVQELQLSTAFGKSLTEALFLAHQLDESEDEGGHRRSFVVKVSGSGAKIIETLPHPAYQSWLSANGTAYVTSDRGELWLHDHTGWSRERVCDEQVQLRPIWGWSGKTRDDDIVITATDTSLYVRSNAAWQTHAIPPVTDMVFRLHGLTPTEVYITTGYGLWMWDGNALGPVEGPEGDLSGVRVVSDDEMVVTARPLFRWTTAGGWKEIGSEDQRHTIAVELFGGHVYVGTAFGVVRLDGDKRVLVTEIFCNLLVNVGDHLVAAGDKTLLFDGQRWRPLDLPMLARGQTP